MSSVFVVYYCYDTVYGIFSSREKAEKFIGGKDCYDIVEWDLDGELESQKVSIG